MGSEAHRIWLAGGAGQVIAVFRRSFYVQCEAGVICVGLASLGEGPLHVLLNSDRSGLLTTVKSGQSLDFDQALYSRPGHRRNDTVQPSVDASGACYSGQIKSDNSFGFTERHAEILRACAAMSTTRSGFGWLLDETVRFSEQGLSERVVGENTAGLNAVERGLRQYVFPAIQLVYEWLAESLGISDKGAVCNSGDRNSVGASPCGPQYINPLSGVQKLLGAGSGLTPAGDDLLAGVMLALYFNHRADLVAVLWEALEPSLAHRTNVISSAHLRLAARGQCTECMLQLMKQMEEANQRNSSVSVECLARNVQALADNIGSSSGWDTLAGISLVIRATIDDHSTRYAR